MSYPTKGREYHIPKTGSIRNLQLTEGAVPRLRSTEVLVRIRAVSLQFRDLMIVKGGYAVPMKANVIPCSDGAGDILAVGTDVTRWHPGDRVCANFALDHLYGDTNPEIQKTAQGGSVDGTLAEYRVYPEHSLVRIPDFFTYEEASTLPCAALTAYNALNGPARVKGGDTVLVLGTGGVSIFALQFAVACGATVIATSSSDEKLAVAKKLGATHLINYKTTPQWDEEVLRMTDGRGVDHILEVGGPGTIGKSIKAVRVAGWIHLIGALGGVNGDAQVVLAAIGRAYIMRGIHIGSVDQFHDMNRLITAHKIKPVIDKVFTFEQAVEAYEYLDSQKHVGKVVISV